VQTKDPETWEKEQAEEEERARVREEEEAARKAEEQASKDKGKGKARDDGEAEAPPATGATAAQATATALFSKLSTSLSTSQAQIQASLAQAVSAAAATANTAATTAQANTAQLRTQIAENVRLQSARENITLSLHQAEKLAEEYLKKGEGYLKEVERVAEKWVEENVRVVAPEGGDFVPSSGWETGEWYAFSTVSPGPSEPATPAAGPAGAGAKHSSAALAGSRKEALLRRLREDKDLLMVDPASEAETKERRDEFAAWVADKWPTSSQDGRAAEEGNVGTIRMALVPEHLSDEQFWQRYLFHKDMIEAADAKRKLLLQGESSLSCLVLVADRRSYAGADRRLFVGRRGGGRRERTRVGLHPRRWCCRQDRERDAHAPRGHQGRCRRRRHKGVGGHLAARLGGELRRRLAPA
jgi:hypothetical protein